MHGTRPAKRDRALPLRRRFFSKLATLTAALALWGSFGCESTPDVEFEEVRPAEELYAEGLEILEGTSILGVYTYVDYPGAIEVFQSIMDNYPYSEFYPKAELQIADAYFASGKYEEALTYYRDFPELHPQNPKVPYAIYRSALCHAEQVRSPGRDQAPTRKALEFLDRLIVAYPSSEYSKDAEKLWRELRVRLAEHSEQIADFYHDTGEYEAAAERYRQLLNTYPGLGLDARILFKLALAYEALERLDEADRIYRTIVAHYPKSPFAFRANGRIASSRGLSSFATP